MSTGREEIMAEAADYLAWSGAEMVDELPPTGNWRTLFVGAARIDGVEGIVHIVRRGTKTKAIFTSDETYRERWGTGPVKR